MIDESYLARMKQIMLNYGFGSQIIQYMLVVEGYTVPKSRRTITKHMDMLKESFTDEERIAYESRNEKRIK